MSLQFQNDDDVWVPTPPDKPGYYWYRNTREGIDTTIIFAEQQNRVGRWVERQHRLARGEKHLADLGGEFSRYAITEPEAVLRWTMGQSSTIQPSRMKYEPPQPTAAAPTRQMLAYRIAEAIVEMADPEDHPPSDLVDWERAKIADIADALETYADRLVDELKQWSAQQFQCKRPLPNADPGAAVAALLPPPMIVTALSPKLIIEPKDDHREPTS